MKTALTQAAVLAGLAGLASGQVVASDDFSYVGALTSNGWAAHSGAGAKVVMSDGSVATLDQSSGSGEDVQLVFAPFGATDTIYASFTMNVPSGNPVNPDVNGLYFAHFKDANFAFRARTGLVSPVGGGDFGLAINGDNSALGAGATWATDLAFDTDYTVVISWDAATGAGTLWLDPVDMASTSISHTGAGTGDLMEGFALRQSNDYTGFITVDNVLVGNSFADVAGGAPVANTYCTGKTSSVSCVPFISFTGAPSATATTPFQIRANDVVPAEAGFIIYSFQKSNLNFHGGKLCVKSPVVRTGAKAPKNPGGGCSGWTLTRNFNGTIQGGLDPALSVGATVRTQWRQRDPLDTTGFGDGLTDALAFTIAP